MAEVYVILHNNELISHHICTFYCVCVSVCTQEKAMGNRPSEMMDREKAYIPELQISFMEHIAMPIYKCVYQKITSTHQLFPVLIFTSIEFRCVYVVCN